MVAEKGASEVPDWVPDGVRRAAQLAFGADPPAQVKEAMARLVGDPRMATVWRELTKRKREGHAPTAAPFHQSLLPQAVKSWWDLGQAELQRAHEFRKLGDEESATIHEERAAVMSSGRMPETLNPPPVEVQEQLALAYIFSLAISIYCEGNETISQKVLSAQVRELRTDGKNKIADAWEQHTAMPQNARMIVQRRRTDPLIEAFIEQMAWQTRETFGDVLPGTIATIVNVLFIRHDFDRDGVRAVLKSRRDKSTP